MDFRADVEALPLDWAWIHGTPLGHRSTSRLLGELSPQHRLRGTAPEVVALRTNLKDVICWLPNEGRWARVHFTGRSETIPELPWTEVFDEWEQVANSLPHLLGGRGGLASVKYGRQLPGQRWQPDVS